MNFRSPQFWLALISLSAVCGYAAATLTRSSPGPVSGAHAQDSSLTGPFSCASCHGGWLGDMTSSCLECHEEIAEQLETRKGLHGIQAPELAASCQACHSEHHGEEFRLVNAATFAMAGIAERDEFDHSIVGYEMVGKHLEQDCSKCHENADVQPLPQDAVRYLGLDKDCASCHSEESPHDGRMQIACDQCHGQTAWDAFEAPSHDRYLPLLGAHGQLDCAQCHESESALDLEQLGARHRRAYKQNCLTCHESPHREDTISSIAAAEERSFEASCALCHEADHMSFADDKLGETVTAERHAFTGFPLDDPHEEQTCASCHGDVTTGSTQFLASEGFTTRHPGRQPDQCATCHDDVHEGEFDDSPLAPGGCVDCHATTHFDPHEFTAEMHDATPFPLTGSHRDNECRACHESIEDGPARFSEAPHLCDDCHDDAHAGYFERFSEEIELVSTEGSCAHCHETTHFADLEVKPFDHEHFTGLAINGAHDFAGCESCHERSEAPDEFGRRFGRVSEHFGDYVGCVTCHDDAHSGVFEHPDCPEQVEGRAGCARCHTSVSFRALEMDFDHQLWTGFLLRGAHKAAECTACHEPKQVPDPETKRSYERAKGRECTDCHDSPHREQFVYRSGEPIECTQCHRVSTTFGDLSFDHDLHSRFKLGPAHRDLACDKCHQTEDFGDGAIAVRYRPIPHDCSDCHGSAGSPFRPRRKTGD